MGNGHSCGDAAMVPVGVLLLRLGCPTPPSRRLELPPTISDSAAPPTLDFRPWISSRRRVAHCRALFTRPPHLRSSLHRNRKGQTTGRIERGLGDRTTMSGRGGRGGARGAFNPRSGTVTIGGTELNWDLSGLDIQKGPAERFPVRQRPASAHHVASTRAKTWTGSTPATSTPAHSRREQHGPALSRRA